MSFDCPIVSEDPVIKIKNKITVNLVVAGIASGLSGSSSLRYDGIHRNIYMVLAKGADLYSYTLKDLFRFECSIMPGHIFFYLGLSFLIMHEMDAMRCREWRIFPGLSLLSGKLGLRIFVFAQIPIFYYIFWRLTADQDTEAFIKGLDIFMIVHLGLHVLFLKHRNNEFVDWISWVIIIGAGVCGLLDLISTFYI